MKSVIVGIDPGQKGALAVLVDDLALDVYDLKDCIKVTGSFRSLDPVLFNALVNRAISHFEPEDIAIFCEEAQVMGGRGTKASNISMRSIYDSRGVMRSVFFPRGYQFTYIQPQSWKRYFGLLKQNKEETTKENKARSVRKACEMFPEYKDFFTKPWRGKDIPLDGRAEASLIAFYGTLILKGEICNGKKKNTCR